MFCFLFGDYEFHLELKEKSHRFLYVNHRVERCPGKIEGEYPYPNIMCGLLFEDDNE